MKNNYLNCHGFTLSEIMLVVIILGVLASLALPQFGSVVESFKSKEGVSALLAVYGAEQRFKSDTGVYTAAGDDLSDGYLDIVEVGGELSLKHFDQPVLLTSQSSLGGDGTNCTATSRWVAYIERSSGTFYTLCVDGNGEIFCKGDVCGKLSIPAL